MIENTMRTPYTILLPNGYYQNIDKSIIYDKRLMMETNTGKRSVIEKFVENVYNILPIRAPKINTKHKKDAINNLVCNLVVTAKKGKALAFPRRAENYSNCSWYGLEFYTYNNMIGSADAFIEKKYAERWRGYWDKDKKTGKVTRMQATNLLLDELNKFTEPSIVPLQENEEPCEINYLYGEKIARRRFNNPIVLKDKDKNMISYPMNETIRRMKNFLENYNDFVGKNNIILPEHVVINHNSITLNPETQSFTGTSRKYISSCSLPLLVTSEAKCNNYIELDCWLYRVFNNGKFDEGGRFYGAEYQSLNENERAQILINDNKVVEVDYKAYHLRMLYHLLKIDYKGDPYLAVTEAKELRPAIKKMAQMIINAKTEYEAVMAFEKYLNEEPEMKNIVYSEGLDGRELLKMITHTHKRIEKYFNTGIGIKLQFVDSKIAERILKHFTRKKIVCLCVHDSFILERQYVDELIDEMKKEYKRELGFDCELKVGG